MSSPRELVDHRRKGRDVLIVEPPDEIRVDAPAVARAADLGDEVRNAADQRVRGLEHVFWRDRKAGPALDLPREIRGRAARLAGDDHVAQDAEHTQVELPEARTRGFANP